MKTPFEAYAGLLAILAGGMAAGVAVAFLFAGLYQLARGFGFLVGLA